MYLDLTNQAHRDALRWACGAIINKHAVRGVAGDPLSVALLALSSAPSAALLLQTLLERLGVRLSDVRRSENRERILVILDYEQDAREWWYHVKMSDLPAKVIALLDIEPPNPERAIAVLKGNV